MSLYNNPFFRIIIFLLLLDVISASKENLTSAYYNKVNKFGFLYKVRLYRVVTYLFLRATMADILFTHI